MKQVDTKNVGQFIVLKAPLNPIGAFDAETFKSGFRSVVEANAEAKFVGVDLTGIEFVYSDAYNAFMQLQQELSSKGGTFAVIADKESLVNSLKKVGLDQYIQIYSSEESMVASSSPAAEVSAAPSEEVSSEPDIVLDDSDALVESEPDESESHETGVSETKPRELETQAPAAPISKPKILDKNPLEDEPSSNGCSGVVVIVFILIAVLLPLLFYVIACKGLCP